MKKLLHIVPKEFSALTLKHSFESDKSLEGEIISLNDDLSLGPLTNLHTPKGIAQRKKWWKEITVGSEDYNWRKKDWDESAKYEQIRKLLKRDLKIIFWFGKDARDRLTFMRFAWELRKQNPSLYIMDYPYAKIKNMHGNPVPFVYIGLVQTEAIPSLKKYIRKMKKSELNAASSDWEKISASSATARIISSRGKIKEVPENYYDETLIKNCPDEFTKAARVMGHTLVDVDFRAGDTYLNHRLKECARAGKIESQGELRNLRDYQVRKKK